MTSLLTRIDLVLDTNPREYIPPRGDFDHNRQRLCHTRLDLAEPHGFVSVPAIWTAGDPPDLQVGDIVMLGDDRSVMITAIDGTVITYE